MNIIDYDGVIWDEEEVEWLGDRETKEGEPCLHRLTGNTRIPDSPVTSS